jgi:hypothetical protein
MFTGKQATFGAEIPGPNLRCIEGRTLDWAKIGVRFYSRIAVETIIGTVTPMEIFVLVSQTEALETLGHG